MLSAKIKKNGLVFKDVMDFGRSQERSRMQLYGLKTCDTCRKAMKILKNAEFIDVRAVGVPTDILQRAHAQFDAGLVNTRSTTWRTLDAVERTRPALELLRAYPALMKRPLIVDNDTLYLGWGSKVQAALGLE